MALVQAARRELWIYTRDLEPSLYGHPDVVDALRAYAVSGRAGRVHVLLQEPATVLGAGHPLLALAQRLSSVFVFRTPVDPVDHQYRPRSSPTTATATSSGCSAVASRATGARRSRRARDS